MRESLSMRSGELQFLFCLFIADSYMRARRGMPTPVRDRPDRDSKHPSSIVNKIIDKLRGAKRGRSGEMDVGEELARSMKKVRVI